MTSGYNQNTIDFTLFVKSHNNPQAISQLDPIMRYKKYKMGTITDI